MNRKKIALVTGGAGFIGSHLCERLKKEGYRVISLDNYFTGSKNNHISGVEYVEGHTKNIEDHITVCPDIVYHLGEYARVEQSFEDIEKVWDFNKYGTFAVLEFCRRNDCKIVYAGSSTKFGDDGLGRDQSPYAWVKATNTELVKNYASWFGIRYAITYFYNVYGPREISNGPYATVIGIFKEEYKNRQPITVVSPGTQKRNFTHVNDIVEGLFLVGEKGRGDGYGIGSDTAYTIREVAELFGGEIVMLPERKGNRNTSPVESGKTKALGWHARRSLKDDIYEFKNAVVRKKESQKNILVFSTTFYPDEGPAEKALRLLIEKMPNLHFDVITTRFSNTINDEKLLPQNVTVHKVGYGNHLDKYLLPVLGSKKVRTLVQEKSYLFGWSLFASYGALTALLNRKKTDLPLLITLADQDIEQLSPVSRFIFNTIIKGADQVYASTTSQGHHLSNLGNRIEGRRSFGNGDAFANQIRFVYTTLLNQQS